MGHVKKPAPFRRDGITIGQKITRRWVHTYAQNLSVGDIVTDWGELTGREELANAVHLTFFSGGVLILRNTEIVRAFTEGESVGDSQ